MHFVPLSQAFPFMHPYAVLTFQVTFRTHLEPPEAVLQPDLETNFFALSYRAIVEVYNCTYGFVNYSQCTKMRH